MTLGILESTHFLILGAEGHSITAIWKEGIGQVPQTSVNRESEHPFGHMKVTCHPCLCLVPHSSTVAVSQGSILPAGSSSDRRQGE